MLVGRFVSGLEFFKSWKILCFYRYYFTGKMVYRCRIHLYNVQ